MNAVVSAAPVPAAARAWWREPMMWLVVGGPAAVIAACVATVVLAVSRPDPVVAEDYYRRGIEINKTLERERLAREALAPETLRPAMQARNHAATPVAPPQQPGGGDPQ